MVMDGVKMGACVSLDGTLLGQTTNQWLRYSWPVSQLLRPGKEHELQVSFDATVDTHGRFMACSGGWDWAPMSTTITPDRSPSFSFGNTTTSHDITAVCFHPTGCRHLEVGSPGNCGDHCDHTRCSASVLHRHRHWQVSRRASLCWI